MSFRIEGPKHIETKNIELTTTHTEESHITTFGDGYANTIGSGISVEKDIPGLAELKKKFINLNLPQYQHFKQFNPTDVDYQRYAYLDKVLDKPEPALCD